MSRGNSADRARSLSSKSRHGQQSAFREELERPRWSDELSPSTAEETLRLIQASTDAVGEDVKRSGTSQSSHRTVKESSHAEAIKHKRSELVEAEIDRLGFASYQWKLFFVCGSGWLLDLLWAHAFGLAMPAIQQELGFSDVQYGYLSTGFSIGMTLGALSWGILLDIVGRRAAFNYTVAISSIFGFFTGFSTNYAVLVLLATGIGFGVGGNIPVDTTIFLEFIPKRDRTMLVVMSIFQPLGSILSTLIAWSVIPTYSCSPELESCQITSSEPCCDKLSNMGWRYMFYTISAVTALVFILRFLVFTMLESPAFLLAHGRDQDVMEVLCTIARNNQMQCKLTIEELLDLAGEQSAENHLRRGSGQHVHEQAPLTLLMRKCSAFDLSHLKLMFKNEYTIRLTILTWLTYAADFWGFTLAGVFLPKILLQKGAIQHVSIADTYFEYIIIACTGVPGALLSMLIIKRGFGSQLTMVVSSALMATSLFLFATIQSKTGNLVFNCIEYFCQTIFNAILYAWTPEAFESSVRGSATGIAAFWGRLISIVAPLLGSLVFASKNGANKVLFTAGGGTLVATICILLLP